MSNPTGKNRKAGPKQVAGQAAQHHDDEDFKPGMFVDETSSVPQYEVLDICHLNNMLIDPKASAVDPKNRGDLERYGEFYPTYVSYRGIPGPHLRPVNDAAREMCEKHADRMQPVATVEALPLTGGNGMDMTAFAKLVATNMVALNPR